jgi:hypothetical protein
LRKKTQVVALERVFERRVVLSRTILKWASLRRVVDE